MENLIACCGLNCATCDARIATINNDDQLRAKTVELWKVQHQIEHLTIEMINCTGCLQPGVKISHCAECEIRNCAKSKGFQTCAECNLLETCTIISPLLKMVPETLANLKSLR